MIRSLFVMALLAGCGGDGNGDGDSDADTDTDSDGDVCLGGNDDADLDGFVSVACGGDDCDDADRGVHPGPACETLNVPEAQTPDEITVDPMCESGDYERSIEDLVLDGEGRPLTWTEIRVYQRPDKSEGMYHRYRTEYEVQTRCSDGRIEEFEARMSSMRPMFESSCMGVYCFEGL